MFRNPIDFALGMLRSNSSEGVRGNPALRARSHRDVNYEVGDRSFKRFDQATEHAVAVSASGRGPVEIDVIVWSESGARWWGGDYAVEQYREDPEASVFERIVVHADNQGRVP